MITGTDEVRARSVASELSAASTNPVLGIGCDVCSEESVQSLAKKAQSQLGVIHVLVNNAGVATRNPIADITLAEWNGVIETNLTGAFLCTRELLPMLRAAPAPVIVNISSQAGKRGQALLGHYVASKAALIGLTRTLALELAPHFRVNAVCPGQIETDMLRDQYEAESRLLGVTPEEVRANFIQQIPLRRMQSPESIAAVVAFLASEDAMDITGEAINVSGGLVMD